MTRKGKAPFLPLLWSYDLGSTITFFYKNQSILIWGWLFLTF